MAESPLVFEANRYTLSATPLKTTQIFVPASATSVMIRPEGNNARLAFQGTDDTPIGVNYITLTMGILTTIPVGTAAIFVAVDAVSPEVQVLFT